MTEIPPLERMIDEAVRGSKAALSRLISLAGEGGPISRRIIAALPRDASQSRTIGFAGAAGAGKSTLISILAARLAQRGKVAILCVDPSSPLGHGAILADRIRMIEISKDPNIFIRSFSTGYALGGLSASVSPAIRILRSTGYRYIMVEGIGSGQLDFEPLFIAHTRVIVLTPSSGDNTQMIKSGIMELGDIYVVNKSDQPNANLVANEVTDLLKLYGTNRKSWVPAVIKTSTTNDSGIDELATSITAHLDSLEGDIRELHDRENQIASTGVRDLLLSWFNSRLADVFRGDLETRSILGQCATGELTSAQAGLAIISRIIDSAGDDLDA